MIWGFKCAFKICDDCYSTLEQINVIPLNVQKNAKYIQITVVDFFDFVDILKYIYVFRNYLFFMYLGNICFLAFDMSAISSISLPFITSCPSCSSWLWRKRPSSRRSHCNPILASTQDLPEHCKEVLYRAVFNCSSPFSVPTCSSDEELFYTHFLFWHWKSGGTVEKTLCNFPIIFITDTVICTTINISSTNLQNQTITPRRSCLTAFCASFPIVDELEAPLQPNKIRSVGTSTWGEKGLYQGQVIRAGL